MRITRVKQSAGRPTAVGGRNSRGQPWTAMMAVDGRDGCGRPRTTVAAVDGNEQLLTAVDGSDGCGRMPTAVDRRGRLSMAMMLADIPGLRWRDAQGPGSWTGAGMETQWSRQSTAHELCMVLSSTCNAWNFPIFSRPSESQISPRYIHIACSTEG